VEGWGEIGEIEDAGDPIVVVGVGGVEGVEDAGGEAGAKERGVFFGGVEFEGGEQRFETEVAAIDTDFAG